MSFVAPGGLLLSASSSSGHLDTIADAPVRRGFLIDIKTACKTYADGLFI